jgi:hypothetical protein
MDIPEYIFPGKPVPFKLFLVLLFFAADFAHAG